MSAWVTPTSWTALKTSSVSSSPAPGYRYCFDVRATDNAGNVGPWSSARCTTVPYDDRQLKASSGWNLSGTTAWFHSTYRSTSRYGATLSMPTTTSNRHVGIIGYHCSTCGTVDVYVGSVRAGRISLASSTSGRLLAMLPAFTSTRDGTIRLVASSPTGRLVRIDALVLNP